MAGLRSVRELARSNQRLSAMRRLTGALAALVLVTACASNASPTSGPVVPRTSVPETVPKTPVTQSPTTSTLASTPTTVPLGDACVPFDRTADEVLAFFAKCPAPGGEILLPVYQPGAESLSLVDSMQALVGGTAAPEQAVGLFTGFDDVEERSAIEVVVTIDNAGTVTLDFLIGGERWNPGTRAGTSHQLLSFLEPVEATLFHHPEVTGLDRTTLCWGELGCVGVITRTSWQGEVFLNQGVLLHRGCDLEKASYLRQCTLEGVESLSRATVVDVAEGDTLNVRAGPGPGYFVITDLAPGTQVEALDASGTAVDGGRWQLIRIPDAEAGWVNESFLEIG